MTFGCPGRSAITCALAQQARPPRSPSMRRSQLHHRRLTHYTSARQAKTSKMAANLFGRCADAHSAPCPLTVTGLFALTYTVITSIFLIFDSAQSLMPFHYFQVKRRAYCHYVTTCSAPPGHASMASHTIITQSHLLARMPLVIGLYYAGPRFQCTMHLFDDAAYR